MDDNLTAKGVQGGGYQYEYKGVLSLWRVSEARMRKLDDDNRLPFTHTGGTQNQAVFGRDERRARERLVDRSSPVNSQAEERTGCPTRKPLKLLERIIPASSNLGDMVLDPFCGCATTCVAAETLGRRWAGNDLSLLAVKLVGERLQDHHGVFGQIVAREDIPQRDDLGTNYRTHRHTLYGHQEGVCTSCFVHFPFRTLTVDHIVPSSKGRQRPRKQPPTPMQGLQLAQGRAAMETLIADLLAAGIRNGDTYRSTRR